MVSVDQYRWLTLSLSPFIHDDVSSEVAWVINQHACFHWRVLSPLGNYLPSGTVLNTESVDRI